MSSNEAWLGTAFGSEMLSSTRSRDESWKLWSPVNRDGSSSPDCRCRAWEVGGQHGGPGNGQRFLGRRMHSSIGLVTPAIGPYVAFALMGVGKKRLGMAAYDGCDIISVSEVKGDVRLVKGHIWIGLGILMSDEFIVRHRNF